MPRWLMLQAIPSDELTEWFAYVQMEGYREKWSKQPLHLTRGAVEHQLFKGVNIVNGLEPKN